MSARGARSQRPRTAPHDLRESAFASILADFVARVPGAQGVVLVDRDGETVDYAGRGDPYEMRLAAAHLRIVLDQATGQPSLVGTRSLLVRAKRSSFSVHALPDGYALVVSLVRGAGFRGLTRAFPVCARLLAIEAGWEAGPMSWHPVEVVVDARLAPRAVRFEAGGAARGGPRAANEARHELPLEVLGRYRSTMPEHEKAWRVRLENGVELTLVREAGGRWYADEALNPAGI
jgi:hypothetical protein